MLRTLVRDVLTACSLLTRLPLPAFDWPGHPARAVWAFPLVGLLIGALSALTGALALRLGLPATGAAGLALGVQILATGALHEDGLADVADGFWGGTTRERRLEIMKDSRIGSYGVLALVLSMLLRWSALTAALAAGAWAGILAVAILSRAMMPPVMALLPQARPGGLAATLGVTPGWSAGVAVALALLAGAGLIGADLPVLLLGALLGAGGIAALARAKIGGQTGDVLGAVQQTAETAALLALVTTL